MTPDAKMPGQQQMVAPQSGAQMVARKVKIKANEAINVSKTADANIIAPGDTAEVDEDTAKEFCDRKFNGYYAFGGERMGADAHQRHVVTRATRLN